MVFIAVSIMFGSRKKRKLYKTKLSSSLYDGNEALFKISELNDIYTTICADRKNARGIYFKGHAEIMRHYTMGGEFTVTDKDNASYDGYVPC